MSLAKLINTTETILFIDSLNLSIRAYKKHDNNFVLYDAELAMQDPELARCIGTGMVQMFDLEEEISVKTTEPVAVEEQVEGYVMGVDMATAEGEGDDGIVEESSKPEGDGIVRESKTEEELDQDRREAQRGDNEPKNSMPVVMFGDDPKAVKTSLNGESTPDFIEDDILCMGDATEDFNAATADIQDGDIIYADDSNTLIDEAEGMIDEAEGIIDVK